MVTPHGDVETPVFMPVGTLGSVKGVPQHLLEELGVQILLSNTYHLYLRPGTEQVRAMGGLHKFMSWERAILTDSGGYQVFSLNDLRKVSEEGVKFRSHLDGSSHFFSAESAMAAQIALGADIVMAFDECTEYPADRGRAQASMEMTSRWAERSKKYFEEHKREVAWRSFEFQVSSFEEKQRQSLLPHEARECTGGTPVPHEQKQQPQPRAIVQHEQRQQQQLQPRAAVPHEMDTQALFGIVQGGMFTDLRVESARRTVEVGFPGYAIGGLSVGEPRRLTREVIEATLPHLPEDKPRYVMGVGYPEEIVQYAAMGVDMMDCVLPTRAARHGLLFTSEGRMNIKNSRFAQDEGPLDSECGCWVCGRYTRAYLRHLYVSGEPLAGVLNTVHNLAHYLDTMSRVRHAIRLGELPALLSRSVRDRESAE
jgi:queuine tRNA-ribosyltransferase